MMRKLILTLCFIFPTLPAKSAPAQDLSRVAAPNKWLESVLPENLPALQYPGWANDLDRARMQAFHGRYKHALLTLQKVKDAEPAKIALIRATSLAALGRRDEALLALSPPEVKDAATAQLKRAEILAELGRTSEAIQLLNEHLRQNPDSLAGRYWIGHLYEQVGDLDQARAAFSWFAREPQDFLKRWQSDREKAFDSAEEVTLIARALDRWATLHASYQDLPGLHQTLADMFVRAYDVIDRTYWPARIASAEYFLSHDNGHQAKIELSAALKSNPNDVRALELLGLIALSEFDFDKAETALDAIRNVDSSSIRADLLDARNLLHQRRPHEASRPIERAVAAQPENLEALGLQAATFALQVRDDQAQRVLKRIEQLDPDNASAYFEVAQQLAAMRQYPRSASMYKVAIERAPWWTAARNGLGLLYTQSGDEDEALRVLDEAHKLDPFNLATTNYLRLLDDLMKFARKETEHFIVMYDAKQDPLIAEYFSEYLESIHPQLVRAFDHEPGVKTYIEVFPTHDAFSVRTTGSPWIGTVGASTGRVIALASPRRGEMTLGTFNWAQVLRHEYAHTVTLSATDNRIPHWMTEGLAVLEERAPLRWEWVPMLYHAVTKDELFTMDNLTWGFVRPKKPNDRSLAYAQSFWICRYIEESYGHDAILKMLAEFRRGRPQEEVFPSVLGKSVSEFTEEFFAWARREVGTWGYDEQSSKRYDTLRERGESMIKSRRFAEAVPVWQEIAAIRPVDALPHTRLAGLYLNKEINQPEKGIEHLKVLHAVELKDSRYAKRIARLYRDLNNLEQAQEFAMQAVYVDPYDLDAHKLLAEVYEKAGNAAGLERERRVIPVLENWLKENRQRNLIIAPE